MKNKIPLSDNEFSAKYFKLIKPMFEANLSLMHSLLENAGIKAIIKEARRKLGITKRGRKPNTSKSFYEIINKHNIPEALILNYTTSFNERQTLNEYVNKILFKYDIYEHFRCSIEIFIIHNLISAPAHNVKISLKVKGDYKSHMPEIHFGRFPYGNDYKVADLLLKRNKQIMGHISDKFKKSYRGSSNLDIQLKVIKEASNRKRVSASKEKESRETYKIRNSEIADIVLGNSNKVETVKKILSRQRKRTKEITFHS